MAKLTPMMEQYFQIKNKYKDCILFYRLGDFYEMFYEDALTASRELEITLTGKNCGQEEKAPMCGVPFHSCEPYINKLVEKGFRVAICDNSWSIIITKEVIVSVCFNFAMVLDAGKVLHLCLNKRSQTLAVRVLRMIEYLSSM